jgi:uncharacterized protein GlcG (DUF336 family)
VACPPASRSRVIVIVALCSIAAFSCSTSKSPTDAQERSAADAVSAARAAAARARCGDLPATNDLQEYLRRAPAEGGEAGGMFGGKMEWAALVNRNGEVCGTAAATEDAASVWPAGQAIAKAKAYTANAFSTDAQPMSSARLYTLTAPGHSFWGVAAPNPFNPDCVESPADASKTDGKICGGTVALGGGVPLYKGKKRIGGLGVSGDTACADHEIAKRIRHIAQLDPEHGPLADDISYSSAAGASIFTHPLCPNTWLNGKKVGDESRAASY